MGAIGNSGLNIVTRHDVLQFVRMSVHVHPTYLCPQHRRSRTHCLTSQLCSWLMDLLEGLQRLLLSDKLHVKVLHGTRMQSLLT